MSTYLSLQIRLSIVILALTNLMFSAPNSLDGFWQSEGYGYVFEVKNSTLKAYEITTTTCVASFVAHRQVGRAATFASKDEKFSFRAGGTRNLTLFHQEETVSDIRLHKINRLPSVCNHLSPDTPLSNFEVFTRTWAEQYISFERRHTDWNQVVEHYRPMVLPETTASQLFDIFQAMIQPLGDLHTYISAPGLKQSTSQFWREGTDELFKGNFRNFADHGRWQLFTMIDQTYLQAATTMFCNKGLHYGHIDDSTGYLRIRSFGNYSKTDDMAALESCLDTILADAKLKSLVIDMRLSFGGSDELGLAMASRLTSRPYLAYAVQARSGATTGDDWTARQEIIVHPSSRRVFQGPIAVLTGPITMSAAESFVEALMGREPSVTRIGENTQGVFCDVLDRHLPNGWTFGLPNAVYVASDRRTFDVTGIPPNIPVRVFDDADVAARRDPALETAKRILLAGR